MCFDLKFLAVWRGKARSRKGTEARQKRREGGNPRPRSTRAAAHPPETYRYVDVNPFCKAMLCALRGSCSFSCSRVSVLWPGISGSRPPSPVSSVATSTEGRQQTAGEAFYSAWQPPCAPPACSRAFLPCPAAEKLPWLQTYGQYCNSILNNPPFTPRL